jgi:hypothetical protein
VKDSDKGIKKEKYVKKRKGIQEEETARKR